MAEAHLPQNAGSGRRIKLVPWCPPALARGPSRTHDHADPQLRRSHLGRKKRGARPNAPPSIEYNEQRIFGTIEHPDRHTGKTYRPTGPERLAPQKAMDHIRAALGRRVKDRPMSVGVPFNAPKSDRQPIFVHTQPRAGMRQEVSAISRDGTIAPTGSNLSCVQDTGKAILLVGSLLVPLHVVLLVRTGPRPERPGREGTCRNVDIRRPPW